MKAQKVITKTVTVEKKERDILHPDNILLQGILENATRDIPQWEQLFNKVMKAREGVYPVNDEETEYLKKQAKKAVISRDCSMCRCGAVGGGCFTVKL